MKKSMRVSLECYVWWGKRALSEAPYLVQDIDELHGWGETDYLLTPLFREFGHGQKVRITVEAIE